MNLIQIISFPILFIKALFYLFRTKNVHLPGLIFDKFGRFLGLQLLLKGKVSLKLLLNPVSIVRYFEFDFILSNLDNNLRMKKILDIASPYLFGFYIAKKESVEYTYINPDSSDLNQVSDYSKTLRLDHNFKTQSEDATNLSFEDNTFDYVFCISVIEHINGDGDKIAMKEMFRVLKPGGVLFITFPVQNQFEIEYRERDIYQQSVDEFNGKFFFQRKYDENSINQRLLSILSNYIIERKTIFGEIENTFYKNYSQNWKKNGLHETVKDPYYISKYFNYFSSIGQLPGIGVIGLKLRKI